MIKLKTPNGTTIELNSVEDIPADMLRMILGLTEVTIPVPAAIQITEEGPGIIEAVVIPSYIKRGPTRQRTLNPPVPAGRWPDLIYMTKEWMETFTVLRQYPEGLTSEEVGIGMGLSAMISSGRVNRLRNSTPLIEKFGEKYRMTVIGADDSMRFKIAHNPSAMNKRLGWDRFMARPLPDGRHKRRRA